MVTDKPTDHEFVMNLEIKLARRLNDSEYKENSNRNGYSIEYISPWIAGELGINLLLSYLEILRSKSI